MPVKENIKSNKFLNIANAVRTSSLFWILSFTALTAVAAQITVPVKPVPFTIQTMMVLLAGAFLGAKNGAYSQIVYLFLGCLGLPVFAQIPDPAIGFARLIGPTGGYLLAFPFAAFITGYIVQNRKSYLNTVLGMFAGNLFILLAGAFYLGLVYVKDFYSAFVTGAAVFLLWMVVKVLAAASVYTGISKKYTKLPE
jgi:biotin transport system substrate-specific component